MKMWELLSPFQKYDVKQVRRYNVLRVVGTFYCQKWHNYKLLWDFERKLFNFILAYVVMIVLNS